MAGCGARALLWVSQNGCGSKIGTLNGAQVNGTKDSNLQSPGGLILTHTQMGVCLFEGVGVGSKAANRTPIPLF